MGRPLSEAANQVRLRLYEQGLEDPEIAQELGTARTTILTWRMQRGLPPNRMRKVLTATQCVMAKQFMSDLVRCASIIPTLDVGRFIVGWRALNLAGKRKRGPGRYD